MFRTLEASGVYRSDQGEVWQEIAELQAKAGTHSPTSAMNDVFKTRAEDLRKCDEVFKSVPNQVGLLAFLGGNPAGAEVVSLARVYAKLHLKLVRSYALEGILEVKPETRTPDEVLSEGRKFLDEILAAEEKEFPSLGYGTDYRFTGKGLGGAALVHLNEVIHAAFFRLDESEKPTGMASLRQRRWHFSRE